MSILIIFKQHTYNNMAQNFYSTTIEPSEEICQIGQDHQSFSHVFMAANNMHLPILVLSTLSGREWQGGHIH